MIIIKTMITIANKKNRKIVSKIAYWKEYSHPKKYLKVISKIIIQKLFFLVYLT